MKCPTVLALLSFTSSVVATRDNPVQKVLQLLGELEAKVIKDGESEQKAFESYADWCQNGAKDKEFEIKTAKADIEGLKATIIKADADIESMTSKISELAASITTDESDLKAATAIRDSEFKEFSAADAELVDALDTLDRAIALLEKNLKGSALVQARVDTSALGNVVQALSAVIEAASMNSHDKNTLLGLVQSDSDFGDGEDLGAPDPTAYKQHSSNIVDVLEDMREKAEAQMAEGRKAELNSKHNYDMLKQSLEYEVAANNEELSDSKTTKANAEESKAVAEGDLAVTEKAKADAEKTLGSMHGDCMSKATEHEDSVASRAEELKALAEAKKIISTMTEGATNATYSFLQVGDVIGSIHAHMQTKADLANFEVVTLLKKLGKEQHSPELMQLAGKVASAMRLGRAAGQDPFVKVKELIKGMIERLLKEGQEEASFKAYCDQEMGKTKKKRMELAHDVEVLNGKIDKAKSASAKLKTEVSDLQKELAELAKSSAELDKIRGEEKAVYKETKADLEQGLDGVRMALKVLKDYYSASPEFLQAKVQQPDAPGTHSASDAGSGIIGMLEVIESDFSKNLAAATAEEEAAQSEYEKTVQANKISKITKEQDVKYKTKEYTGLDKEISELSSDLEGVLSEQDAVLAYTKTIRGQCELKPESYEDRKDRREAEIAGLKEALTILDGEAVLLQKKLGKQHSGRGLRGTH